MRFASRKPKNKERRVRSWFAWLPVSVTTHRMDSFLPDRTERRWLERVSVRQRFDRFPCGASDGSWNNEGFIDGDEEKKEAGGEGCSSSSLPEPPPRPP